MNEGVNKSSNITLTTNFLLYLWEIRLQLCDSSAIIS